MKTAIVTGATSGLGLVTARALVRLGMRVVLPARDPARAARAVDRITAGVPDASVEAHTLDLADLRTVRRFAETFEAEHGQLDLLVNNAGIMWGPRTETADGFEAQLGINHLGHFALTGLLLPLLHRAPAGRVVTVGSMEHLRGVIDFDDLQLVRGYHPRRAYQRAKLANVMFGLELDRRLRRAQSPVRSVLAHPGAAATGLQTRTTARRFRPLAEMWNRVLLQTPEQGARAQIQAALDSDIAGGSYIGPTRLMELRGPVGDARIAPAARDLTHCERLWAVSEELVEG
ncbi:SDR family NAD(P)-dependent oxidoreductase [Natronosporangium hydrolyticum]|uniref:SDR family NAD(P)-dependent oxidoreductase n=1 Tax=Natronosporangium hydrolyticum TaxID=2811111 RepID=A0A895YPJ9_9ACTN|nr:oxidoreductase [Natronosporangium hydrolyticum]QSB16656.1 SDR family NAD(P)-dependent oxidoreductase [Natronosporangium hydrolyticum]